jgi:hypothetical protein
MNTLAFCHLRGGVYQVKTLQGDSLSNGIAWLFRARLTLLATVLA